MRIHLDYCDRSQLVRMFSRFYPPSSITPTTQEGDSGAKFCGLDRVSSSDQIVTPHLSDEKVHPLAVRFATQLEGVRVSSAQVQGYLLLYKDNPTGALHNVNLLKQCGTQEDSEQSRVKPLSTV